MQSFYTDVINYISKNKELLYVFRYFILATLSGAISLYTIKEYAQYIRNQGQNYKETHNREINLRVFLAAIPLVTMTATGIFPQLQEYYMISIFNSGIFYIALVIIRVFINSVFNHNISIIFIHSWFIAIFIVNTVVEYLKGVVA